MRKGQRGKFIGNENYDGDLMGGELFTVTELIEYFPEEKSWVFKMELDTGGGECLLSDMVEMFTEADDLMTLKNLINKYPEQANQYLGIKRNK